VYFERSILIAFETRMWADAQMWWPPSNLWKRKPQQVINHECASVKYTESTPTEAQLSTAIVYILRSRKLNLRHALVWDVNE